MRRPIASLVVLIMLATPAYAQDGRPLSKYGKWMLAAGAMGMYYLASESHDLANDNYRALGRRCFDDPRLCDLDASGRYSDPGSEELYQESLRYDRRARRWLFGGEAALVGAAVIFLSELARHTPKPDNIPFEPELRSLYRGAGVGLKVPF
jgi:hypothetical protein